MTGPSWLAGTFAAVMILIAVYSAGRLCFAWLRGRATETDADALHIVMGTAMAGMLVPRLSILPGGMWVAVFAAAAAWFGWHAIHGPYTAGSARCRYPVPHLIECAAMVYMLLPAAAPRPAQPSPGMAMPGMGASAGLPALPVVLALFMTGYIVWTTDHLAALARSRTRPRSARPRRGNLARQTQLAPKLAAGCKIAMSIAMGYMLILML